jgi:hypothetical protein
MRCLSREEMQEYIDNEVTSDAENEIVKHIAVCEKCLSLYNEVNEDKTLVNEFLNSALPDYELVSVPEFKLPVRKAMNKKSYRLVAVLAAATLIGFIFLIRFDKKPVMEKIPEAEILMNEFYEGQDLNRLWHDKSQILIIQDEKGNVIQSIITN